MKILVTGGSGYIASWIISYLLEDGQSVVATVRDKSNTEKAGHLLRMAEEKKGSLELHEADLLEEGSFEGPVKGCDIVIHTASPFKITGIKDARKELIEPAVEGTRNVLKAVNGEPSVQKVVLTSSVAAIFGDNEDILFTSGKQFNDQNWNHTSSPEHHPYAYSKTIAEEEAWKMVNEQKRWRLAVINPGLVTGPSLSKRKDSFSINLIITMLNGTYKWGLPRMYFGLADVRDVARAHVLAAFDSGAAGRFIIVSETKTTLEMAEILRNYLGEKYKIPKRKIPKLLLYLFGPFQGFTWKYINLNVNIPVNFDTGKAQKRLKMDFIPVQKSLQDQADQIIKDKLLNI
ncbi:MAG: aldehyde reductase [Bacteroidales bacterium]